MLRKIVTALVLGAVFFIGGTTAAYADPVEIPELTASPASIVVGGATRVTAAGLGDATTALFTTDRPDASTLDPAEAAVAAGSATTLFSATAPGSYTVGVSVEGSVVASTVIAVVPFDPALSASATLIAVGDYSTVRATGLGLAGGLMFITSDPVNAIVDPNQAVAVNGTAETTFRATAAGTYTVTGLIADSLVGRVTITVVDPAGTAIAVSPATITVGQTSTVTATGLGGAQTVAFGVSGGATGAGEPAVGTITPNPAVVTNGTATATFTATVPGEYVIDIGDGSAPLATAVITVLAGPSTVSPPPSKPRLADGGGDVDLVALGSGGAAIILGGLLFMLGRRRARQN